MDATTRAMEGERRMKYIIEFEDEYSMNEGGMKYHQCKQVPYWSVSNGIIKNLTPYTEPDRKAIEDEVWEFLDFLVAEMDTDDRYECFHESSVYKIVHSMSYQEAKAKYESWLKQKDEIHVGDEVIPTDTQYDTMIVTRIWMDDHSRDCLDTLGLDGCICSFLTSNVKKTGRHFPKVAELLEKMRGEQDD